MRTPITLLGPVGGIRFDPFATVCDCRLVLALHEIAPMLARLGVTEVRHVGAYAYRRVKGRLSLHAHGVAIDVKALVVDGEPRVVKHDYQRGLDDGCTPEAPVLNRVACELEALELFDEILTPDDDLNHRNHFHLAIEPLAGQ